MKQKRRFQMKGVTFKMFVCVLVMLVIGLNAQADVVEGYIDYHDGKTWYRIVGAEKEGIPLILIHGGPGVPHFYLKSMEAIAIDRPVILYDQRGCGFSDPLEDSTYWTLEFFVEELKQLIEQLQLEEYHILGQSCGGMIAAEFALTQPQGLKSAILASPALDMPFIQSEARRLISTLPEHMQEAIYWAIENNDFSTPEYEEAMIEYYSRYLCRTDPWPEWLLLSLDPDYMNVDIYTYMNGPSDFVLNGTLSEYNVVPDLHKIKVPVLYTVGKYDEVTPIACKYFQDNTPGAKLKIFSKGGHECHLDQPEKYNKEVMKFLTKVERKEGKEK